MRIIWDACAYLITTLRRVLGPAAESVAASHGACHKLMWPQSEFLRAKGGHVISPTSILKVQNREHRDEIYAN